MATLAYFRSYTLFCKWKSNLSSVFFKRRFATFELPYKQRQYLHLTSVSPLGKPECYWKTIGKRLKNDCICFFFSFFFPKISVFLFLSTVFAEKSGSVWALIKAELFNKVQPWNLSISSSLFNAAWHDFFKSRVSQWTLNPLKALPIVELQSSPFMEILCYFWNDFYYDRIWIIVFPRIIFRCDYASL